MRFLIPALVLAAGLAAAPASAMTVSEFLTRADALEKQGVTALFSPDYQLLKQEVKSAGKNLRAQQVSALAAGRKPATCLPEDKVPVNADELLAYFRSLPSEQRRQTVETAFSGLMKKKYPCGA